MLGKDTTPYYKYEPPEVLEGPNQLMYWDRPILTDKRVSHNRPDIVILNKIEKTAFLIHIAIPLTHYIKSTEDKKIRKYEHLAIEMKNIWKLNEVTTIPLVISAEAVVTPNFVRNLEKTSIPNWTFKTTQKIAILQTCHIVRKFLN